MNKIYNGFCVTAVKLSMCTLYDFFKNVVIAFEVVLIVGICASPLLLSSDT